MTTFLQSKTWLSIQGSDQKRSATAGQSPKSKIQNLKSL